MLFSTVFCGYGDGFLRAFLIKMWGDTVWLGGQLIKGLHLEN